MKQGIIVFAWICSAALALSGCQKPPGGGVPVPVEKAAAAAADPAKPSQQAKGFTQEDTGIKVRVDMPEIKTFLQQRKEGPIVPALLQGAVPQGLAIVQEKQWILISYYREGGKSSLLSVTDAATGKVVKVVELYKNAATPYNGHAGGIAASPKHVWVSSGEEVSILNMDDITKAEDGGKLVFQGSVKSDTRASFTAYSDGVLWIGEFARGKDYPTKETHYATNRDGKQHKAWAEGYKLDPATDLPAAVQSGEQGGQPVPDYILSLPDSVQGMYVGKDRIRLSQSFGRNNASALLTFKNSLSEQPHTEVTIGSTKVPVWFLDSKNHTDQLALPPMSEGIVESGDALYILFESGATLYRSSSSYALDRIQILPVK